MKSNHFQFSDKTSNGQETSPIVYDVLTHFSHISFVRAARAFVSRCLRRRLTESGAGDANI